MITGIEPVRDFSRLFSRQERLPTAYDIIMIMEELASSTLGSQPNMLLLTLHNRAFNWNRTNVHRLTACCSTTEL